MRRVVVTGLGIISSIGTSAEEVTASLKAGKSGITFAPDYAEHGFRSQIHGKPEIDPAEHIDKRIIRFMGDGAAYAYLAMEQAIADAGLEESDVSNVRTGLIAGSGGPSTRNMFAAHQIVLEKGAPKAHGPPHGAALHVLDRLCLSRDAVQDQGRELLDHLRLLDLAPLHRQRGRADPVGQAGRHVRGRRRGTRLDPLLPLRRDGRDERPSSTTHPNGRAAPMTPTATAS